MWAGYKTTHILYAIMFSFVYLFDIKSIPFLFEVCRLQRLKHCAPKVSTLLNMLTIQEQKHEYMKIKNTN